MRMDGSTLRGQVLLDRYDVVGEIGRGGFGAVYLAEDRRLAGRRCALKAIRVPDGLPPSEADALRAAVSREAELLAQLDHPALPGVSDHFELDGVSFLVMDYVPGDDLAAIVNEARARDRHLEEVRVVGWARELCAALQYLHHRQPRIIHRDVKPSNVKLTPDGQVRLVDFGLAIPIGDDGGATLTIRAGGGSRAYQPLEQFGDSGGIDPRADIFALGATLYHLLCGVPPVDARTRFLSPGSLVRPRELRPDLSPGVEEAILLALALHPDERPRDIRELRHRLVASATASEPVPEPATALQPPTGVVAHAWRAALVRDRWLIALALTLAAAAAALSSGP